MNEQDLFDECAKRAVSIARKHMHGTKKEMEDPKMFIQEWELALIIFKKELGNEG